MKKHLFLIGDIGAGKSTLIKKALQPLMTEVSGYYVQRVYCDNELIGFRMCSPVNGNYLLDSQVGDCNSKAGFFIEKESQNSWKINSNIFAENFFKYINDCDDKKIILLDEIGGFELNVEEVEKHIYKLLNGNIPVVGVIKSRKNKKRMESIISSDSKMSEEELKYSNLLSHPKIEIVYVDRTNQSEVYRKLNNWVEEIEI
jgi:nucleoside-triphosphatase